MRAAGSTAPANITPHVSLSAVAARSRACALTAALATKSAMVATAPLTCKLMALLRIENGKHHTASDAVRASTEIAEITVRNGEAEKRRTNGQATPVTRFARNG